MSVKDDTRKTVVERIYWGVFLLVGIAVCVFLGYLVGQYTMDRMSVILGPVEPTGSRRLRMADTPVNPTVDQESHTGANQIRVDSGEPDLRGASPIEGSAREAGQDAEPGGALYRVQVGAFSQRKNAERFADELRKKGWEVFIVSESPYRVQVGAFAQKENADGVVSKLKSQGYEAFVTGGW